jgi:hypothetical protein
MNRRQNPHRAPKHGNQTIAHILVIDKSDSNRTKWHTFHAQHSHLIATDLSKMQNKNPNACILTHHLAVCP